MIKRGFSMAKDAEVHVTKGIICIDCHKVKNHKFPTGRDPNNWAHDGIYMTCIGECHSAKPHSDATLNSHTAKIACQTCHIPKTGGAFSKDFTKWEKQSNGFYEPSTLKREVNETTPVDGVLNFKELGYNLKEVEKLTNPELYFEKLLKQQQENE